MNSFDVDTTTRIHECSEEIVISRIPVSSTNVEALRRALRCLKRAIPEGEDLPVIRRFQSLARRQCFYLCATPLELSSNIMRVTNLEKRYESALKSCQLSHPSLEEHVTRAWDCLKVAREHNANPLLDELSKSACIASDQPIAMVLKEGAFIAATKLELKKCAMLSGITPVGIDSLRGVDFYETLILVGSPLWFPSFLFEAPRSSKIVILQFSCCSSALPDMPKFVNPAYEGPRIVYNSESLEQENQQHDEDLDLLPSIDWNLVRQRANADCADHGTREEKTQARLLELAGNVAVWVDASDGATVSILDPETQQRRKVLTRDLQLGNYLLLRTDGGGDMIAPVADMILGDRAVACRESEKHWKDQLRKKMQVLGIHPLVKKLREAGSEIANPQNVRNWSSYKSIKTEKKDDFDAIMKVVGLGSRTDEFWNTAVLIDHAHRKAGRQISRKLFHQVKKTDLGELLKTGRMEFTLPTESGGKLAAFRINVVYDESFTVPVIRLNHPNDLDALQWPE